MDQEHEPFLPAKAESRGESEESSSPNTSSQLLATFKGWRGVVILHTTLILLYTIISIVTIRAARNTNSLRPPPAIDHLDFAYTPTIYHNLTNNPYAGPPSPALDAAWTALLSPMHIRVSEAELRRDNQESVALTEGGGFLGWMGVFHGLHCVKRVLADNYAGKNMLRKWNYKEYYHAGLSAKEKEHLASHVDHCFEMLRQAVLCHGDASLTTFKWHPAKTRPMFNASESVHTCVDWGRLMASVRDRVVDEKEILRLRNPLVRDEG
ncbi:hypothetical protein IMSHALPRED_001378 [Imshaugia aleurites]|uniref:Cyclochlorotine biosynthesis protein O n=1 Tax=Imshaugia aleurites TaxID=172621 RepID=A0A8H3F3A3_9LECA|nr:hypothetical protein IMSHALPRED_001378 [Imshaugia aleurites]